MNTTFRATSYMRPMLDPTTLSMTVDAMVKALEPYAYEFDTIAFSGNSGALLGPLVAIRLKKNMLLVRKEENSHSTYMCEGTLNSRYVIADDLISTGSTVRRIQRQLFEDEIARDDGGAHSVCVGIVIGLPDQNCFGGSRFLRRSEAQERTGHSETFFVDLKGPEVNTEPAPVDYGPPSVDLAESKPNPDYEPVEYAEVWGRGPDVNVIRPDTAKRAEFTVEPTNAPKPYDEKALAASGAWRFVGEYDWAMHQMRLQAQAEQPLKLPEDPKKQADMIDLLGRVAPDAIVEFPKENKPNE